MTQDERAAFEAWAAERWGSRAYLHISATCGEWDAWQARAAIAQPAEPAGVAEAIRWLHEVEIAQGGANGPTIKLRAAILAIGEPVSAEICSAPESDAELERITGEPHIDGWPLYSGIPPAAQADAQPVAPAFDHSIGEGRFRVEKGAFWWHILIGEGTAKVGKFHSKQAAEDVALKLLTAFRDGAFVQSKAAAPPARQPLGYEQITALWAAHMRTRALPNYEEFARAIERAHGIGREGEKP